MKEEERRREEMLEMLAVCRCSFELMARHLLHTSLHSIRLSFDYGK
jgi:hypothetical protein